MLTLRILASTLMLAALADLGAQTARDGTMLAPILRTERAGAGVVRIVYDLRGVVGTAFAVALEASDDGGQTFTVRPQALTGDVGPRVSPGAEKTIVWDTTKDVDNLQVDRYAFRVRVSANGPNSAVASQPAIGGGAAPPAGRGTTGGGSSSGTTAGAKRGGPGKGALIGIAGGAAAGLGVAVAKSKDSNSGSSSAAPPQNLPNRTLTGPFSFQLIHIITSPDGSGACAQTHAHQGSLTMTVQASGGSVTGLVTMIDSATVLTSTCDAAAAGTTYHNFTVGNVPVNGTPTNVAFMRELSGQGRDFQFTYSVSFSGALTAENLSGTLTVRLQSDGTNQGNPRIGQGSATVAVTLR